MVRITAELSINTPTASSGDRYKYRYGCGGGGYNERQQIVYKRPAPAPALVEKEKEKENSEKQKEEVQGVQVINPKLGKISYRSRTGELFFAQHSVHLTTIFVFDKTTGESIQSQTQKVVWNNKVFETKQKWFSEMARLCVDSA